MNGLGELTIGVVDTAVGVVLAATMVVRTWAAPLAGLFVDTRREMGIGTVWYAPRSGGESRVWPR